MENIVIAINRFYSHLLQLDFDWNDQETQNIYVSGKVNYFSCKMPLVLEISLYQHLTSRFCLTFLATLHSLLACQKTLHKYGVIYRGKFWCWLGVLRTNECNCFEGKLGFLTHLSQVTVLKFGLVCPSTLFKLMQCRNWSTPNQ